MTKFASKKILLAAALIGVGITAQAQTPGIDMNGTVGYVIDQRGYVAKSGTGLCWRTGYWTPAMAIAECDPDLVKKEEAPKAAAPAPAAAKPAPKPAAKKVTLAADALFDFDKAVLKPEGKQALDEVGDKIQSKGATVIDVNIVGHTDSIGTEEYNQALSLRRATSVKDYILTKGVDASIIDVSGKGETEPVADNSTKEGRAQNRRVEVSIGVKAPK